VIASRTPAGGMQREQHVADLFAVEAGNIAKAQRAARSHLNAGDVRS
jgi:hypothetical protein